jgi:uncharacterized membrane protein YcaP (DUF421 family)
MNWSELFVPGRSLVELAFRALAMYLGILVLLRVVGQREAGMVGRADLLMMVLIADAAQNALAPEQLSLTEGLVLVGTIIATNYGLDWLGHRIPLINRFLHAGPLPLVRDGRIIWRNMHKEMMSEKELMTHLRQHGIDDLARVRLVYLEGNGQISVLQREQKVGDSTDSTQAVP